jgi:hypothetical protein
MTEEEIIDAARKRVKILFGHRLKSKYKSKDHRYIKFECEECSSIITIMYIYSRIQNCIDYLIAINNCYITFNSNKEYERSKTDEAFCCDKYKILL